MYLLWWCMRTELAWPRFGFVRMAGGSQNGGVHIVGVVLYDRFVVCNRLVLPLGTLQAVGLSDGMIHFKLIWIFKFLSWNYNNKSTALQLIGRLGTAPDAIKLSPACFRHSLADLLYSIPRISRDFLLMCSILGLLRKGSNAAASLLK